MTLARSAGLTDVSWYGRGLGTEPASRSHAHGVTVVISVALLEPEPGPTPRQLDRVRQLYRAGHTDEAAARMMRPPKSNYPSLRTYQRWKREAQAIDRAEARRCLRNEDEWR